MWFSTVIVKLNNQWLYNLTNVGEFTVASGSKNFTAASVKNVICFDSVYDLGDKIKYAWIGPCIDNVTLVKTMTSPTPSNSTNTTTNTNTTNTIATNTTNNITNSSSDNLNSTNSFNTTNTTNFPHTSNTSQITNTTTSQTFPTIDSISKVVTISCKISCEELDNYIIFSCLYDYVKI
jgi:hypothetical protein